MAVGVAGVEVIDRHPIEPGAKVGLHLAHHVAREAAKVRQSVAVLGCDDEAEAVPVLRAPLHEGRTVGTVGVRPIELAALAVARGAVPLQVAQVRALRP